MIFRFKRLAQEFSLASAGRGSLVVKIFDKDWGFLTFEASKYKFDFFPRLTMVTIPQVMEISIGFLLLPPSVLHLEQGDARV